MARQSLVLLVVRRLAIAGVLVVLLAWGVGSAILAENALRPVHRQVELSAAQQERLTSLSSSWGSPSIRTTAGVTLHGWFLQPRPRSNRCVLLLHGIADTRTGVAGHSAMLLDAGLAVLMPDSRAHGESGGLMMTYGLRERDDVLQWARWMRDVGCERVYGLGESMGAAILIQSAAGVPEFDALVAECPFSSLRAVAEDRVSQHLPLPAPVGKLVAKPLVAGAMLYARLRYGLNLEEAAPARAATRLAAPLLLIHGTADTNILPAHSERIAAALGRTGSLWLVPDAGHTTASTTRRGEFRRRVLAWFNAPTSDTQPSAQ